MVVYKSGIPSLRRPVVLIPIRPKVGVLPAATFPVRVTVNLGHTSAGSSCKCQTKLSHFKQGEEHADDLVHPPYDSQRSRNEVNRMMLEDAEELRQCSYKAQQVCYSHEQRLIYENTFCYDSESRSVKSGLGLYSLSALSLCPRTSNSPQSAFSSIIPYPYLYGVVHHAWNSLAACQERTLCHAFARHPSMLIWKMSWYVTVWAQSLRH
jgi:hypothetical protein